tara:strand:+ start:344 stop:715 length:372 start_codon:yes stop_codon:yes gene_type:complete
MNTIDIKIGKKSYEGSKPDSIATCLEFVTLWTDCDGVDLLRLCSGAIGVYLDKAALYPSYKPLKEKPLSYGRKVLEALLKDGLAPAKIYEFGSLCLQDLFKQIPLEVEVEETANFTHSTDSED